ncbi:transcriptional regulator with XRE-family HTH domain [Crossiella equi]|uniref:Transcriptional regulator with XRE-family HTH domain n=1 Tax=Crossiella equi TaxID=130796 RepID=A0ABS5A9A6_9PSEU|nr:XRE family transcriptional regulator [Crossiella equi]MBP2472896.1 transcriptional regulator with XRE-family HTH domain [Crossiella equi]
MSTPPESGPTAEFLARLGREVRRRRQAAGLTVQALADAASLSRRLLTQVEQGTANPSLVTVDRLARALGVDFATLTAAPGVAPLHQSTPVEVWASPRGSRAVLHVSSAHRQGPELWEWTLRPGEHYDAQPDPAGSEELLLVTGGTLVLEINGEPTPLAAGASARLASDRAYTYRAPEGTDEVTFVRVVALAP